MKSVGERIRRAIKVSGLKQMDLVKATGATRSAVSQWVSGETITVKAEYIFAIADATGFEARWLATGIGPEQSREDKQLGKIIEAWPTLDERGRSAVQRAAESESNYIVERKQSA